MAVHLLYSVINPSTLIGNDRSTEGTPCRALGYGERTVSGQPLRLTGPDSFLGAYLRPGCDCANQLPGAGYQPLARTPQVPLPPCRPYLQLLAESDTDYNTYPHP